MAELSIRNLRKSYGAVEVVHGVDIEVPDGEFAVFVGPSGCGKSTILRMIVGLEDITDGEVRIGGRRVNELAPKDRKAAMVFQDYALYPHMTVRDNLSFGLRMQGVSREERHARARETADRLQIGHLLDRRPKQLSGGQRQRVAMGRAIIRSADVFLFDEPLSNLDAKLRIEMRTQIKMLQAEFGATSVFVTHDQVEAMTLADRIFCLHDGRIAQAGTPDEIYNDPQSLFVARFMGAPTINVLEGRLDEGALKLPDAAALPISSQLQRLAIATPPDRIALGVRPEHLELGRAEAAGDLDLPLDVLVVENMGADSYVHGTFAGQQLTVRCPVSLRPKRGERLDVHIPIKRALFFDADSGARL